MSTSAAPPLSTQVIGQAESALGAVLEPLLDRAEITFHQWIVLVITSARGGSANRDELSRQLTAMRKLSEAQAREAVSALVAAGLAEILASGEPSIQLTDAGRTRYRQVREQVDAITGRVFGDLPDADLATAGRVLAVVTARASAEIAAAQG